MVAGSAIVPTVANEQETSLKDLPGLLKQWMTLQEQIATLTAEVNQKRKHGKALRDTILRIMDLNKVAALNVNRGTIAHRVRERAEPVSNAYLMKHLTSFFDGDESKAKNLVDYLESRREVTTVHDLKLSIPKSDDAFSRRS